MIHIPNDICTVEADVTLQISRFLVSTLAVLSKRMCTSGARGIDRK